MTLKLGPHSCEHSSTWYGIKSTRSRQTPSPNAFSGNLLPSSVSFRGRQATNQTRTHASAGRADASAPKVFPTATPCQDAAPYDVWTKKTNKICVNSTSIQNAWTAIVQSKSYQFAYMYLKTLLRLYGYHKVHWIAVFFLSQHPPALGRQTFSLAYTRWLQKSERILRVIIVPKSAERHVWR